MSEQLQNNPEAEVYLMHPLKLEISILKVLVYFDLFRYPLTSNEIRLFLDRPSTETEFCEVLDGLVSTNKIFRINKFFSLHNDLLLAERRIKGSEKAALL